MAVLTKFSSKTSHRDQFTLRNIPEFVYETVADQVVARSHIDLIIISSARVLCSAIIAMDCVVTNPDSGKGPLFRQSFVWLVIGGQWTGIREAHQDYWSCLGTTSIGLADLRTRGPKTR